MLVFLKFYFGFEEFIFDFILIYCVVKYFNICVVFCWIVEGNNFFLNYDIYVLIGVIVWKKNGVDVSIWVLFVIRGLVMIKLN